jgi:uncharacterized membrane protein
MSLLKSALYVKNVPNWERAVRIALALAAVAGALMLAAAPWNWVLAAAGAGLGLSGLVGLCPACAMVGRRLQPRR